MELVFASNNENKIREAKKIFEKKGYKILSLKEVAIEIDPEENGKTYEENSFIKAKAIYDICKKPVIADDSGFEVDELNNEPGIYSARYKNIPTEKERNEYILEKLKNSNNRNARLKTVICYINENGQDTYVMGNWEGKVAKEIKGENGFGYDRIFIPNGFDITVGQMDSEQKNKLSHRSLAFKELEKIL